MRCSEELPPEIVAEVASILARGYLKYRRSLAIPTANQPADNYLDSGHNPSVHVPAVNASGEGEQ
jgi:hypothetical protein